MASFLSQPQQFTQYQDPYSLELYGQIGSAKQQQYDQNVQKVQGYIDNIAGLELVKDVDKAYVQNKLGELRNNLSNLVSQDFAQAEVVNQAGGYATQIYNDPNIQNAVQSTQNIKKYQASKALAKKEGKSSRYNDYYTDRIVNDYMSNNEVGASIGQIDYVDYFDDIKGFQDYIKDINPTITVEVDPVSRNADGSPNWSAYALVEGKRTEISKAEIMKQAQMFYVANPLAAQQLEVNSTFYADHTSDNEAIETYRNSINTSTQQYNNRISQLQERKQVTNGNTKGLDDQISALEIERDTLVKNAESMLSGSPNTLKKVAYQNNLFSSLADRFDRLEIDTKFTSNPIFQGQMEEAKFNQQKQEFAWKQETWNDEFALKQQEFNLKAAEAAFKMKEESGGNLVVNPPEAQNVTAEDVVKKVAALGQSAITDAKTALSFAGISSDGMTDEQVIAKVDQLREEYQSNPLSTNVNLQEYFQNTNNLNAGYGKLLNYTSKRDLLNKAQEDLNTNPSTQQYTQQLSSIGDTNEVIGRVPIWGAPSANDGRRFTNVNQGRITGYRDITLGEYAEMTRLGKKREVPGNVTWINSGLKKKVDDVNNKFSKSYTELKNSNFRAISDATPTVTQTYSTKGTADAKQGQTILNNISVLADRLPEGKIRENLSSVMSDGDDGFVIAATKDGIMGGVTAVVKNVKTGQTSMPIPIPAGNENMFGSLNQGDPFGVIREQLNYAPQTTQWYSPVDFNQGQGYNLDKYKIRGKFAKTQGGSFYAEMQYKTDGTDWHTFRQTKPVGSVEEAAKQMINMGSLDDNSLKQGYNLD